MSAGLEHYYALVSTVVGVAKWLTHRIVIPTFVGSIPITHPILTNSPHIFRSLTKEAVMPEFC